MRADWDVLVIGAGLAGLAAGATATKAGLKTLVFDAHSPGGRARVTERDGFVFNRGIHALCKGGAGWEVLRSLGIEPQGSSPPLGRYQALAGGEFHLLPTSPDSLRRTTLLGRKDKEAYAALLARLARLRLDRIDLYLDGGWAQLIARLAALCQVRTGIKSPASCPPLAGSRWPRATVR
jgi:phytoene dehydrogenase-like protein